MADKELEKLKEENKQLRFEANRSKFGGLGAAQPKGKDAPADTKKLEEQIQGNQQTMKEQAEKIFNIEQEKTKLQKLLEEAKSDNALKEKMAENDNLRSELKRANAEIEKQSL